MVLFFNCIEVRIASRSPTRRKYSLLPTDDVDVAELPEQEHPRNVLIIIFGIFIFILLLICIYQRSEVLFSYLNAILTKREFTQPEKILLYFTTYNSSDHYTYMDCWAKILRADGFLNQADVHVYFGDTSSGEKFHEKLSRWPNVRKQFTQNYFSNLIQEGSILAFMYGFQHDLFDEYDWVIRLNPDVLVYNSSRLQQMMANKTACGIFANCNPVVCENRCAERAYKIQTDFTVFRPKCLDKTEVLNTAFYLKNQEMNAEKHATKIFKPIVRSGRAQWLFKHNEGTTKCRVNWAGQHSGDVEHRHEPCKI